MFEISIVQKKMYLNNRFEEVLLLQNAHGDEKFELAKRIGHMLKGNGKTFGFDEVGHIGQILEEAGADKNLIKLNRQVELLFQFLQANVNKDL